MLLKCNLTAFMRSYVYCTGAKEPQNIQSQVLELNRKENF